MGSDVRVCFVGDSFVAGYGDPEHRGWVGRLAATAPVTVYNLGIRRDTSADVLARWAAECGRRLPAGVDGRVVVSLGVNDVVQNMAPDGSVANLEVLLGEIAEAGHRVLVIGPPPIADDGRNAGIGAVSSAFAGACAAAGVPFAAVFDALVADPVWRAEVAAGDGAHPGAAGYARLAALVTPAWLAFVVG
jgi:lysophospholipase L1-like esterase